MKTIYKDLKPNGFTHQLFLLSAVAITVIGYAGFRIYQLRQIDPQAASGCISYSIKKGSRGGCVKYAQILMNGYFGISIKADGIFGSQTEAAVKKYQAGVGNIKVDGIIGPKQTWPALCTIYRSPFRTYLSADKKDASQKAGC
ncbi:peptidoglycan-binding protein [Candidatus Saccharibacteria bacterium]|nr:peptidoglycan-binding protein [Candidatus Saccharibacteria bacterium]